MKLIFTYLVFFIVTITAYAQPNHDYYWVGTAANGVQASGEWSDLNAWRLDSINGTIPTQVPISSNNVYFDSTAFPTSLAGLDSVMITVSNNANCDTFYWDSTILALSKQIVFKTNTSGVDGPSDINLDIYGTFTLIGIDKLDFDFNGSLRFRSQDTLVTITTAGQKILVKQVVFEGSDTTEFRLMDFFHLDDPKEYHYSRRLDLDGGFCYFYRGYLNFNGQNALIDRFDAYATSHAERKLNIAGSQIQLIGHADYVWRCNFNAAGTNYSFFDATGSHISVKDPKNLSYAQQLWLGDMAYDTISTDVRYYTYLRRGSPSIQHLFIKNDHYFHDNLDATIENLYLYGNYLYRFNYLSPQITVENVFVEADCDEFATIMSWQGTPGKIIKKTPNTQLTLDKVILNGIEGDITNGQTYVANNSVDAGGNVNWTVNGLAAREMRFRFSGVTTNHYWHNISNWEEWNGATWVASACLPTPFDNVYFDAASFPATGNQRLRIDSMAYCHDMRWAADIDNRIEMYPYLYTNTTTRTLNIFGTLELDKDLRMACIGRIFNLWGRNDSIISKGVYIRPELHLQPYSDYTVVDTLAANFLQGLVHSYVRADDLTMNLGRLYVHGRKFDSTEVNLTFHSSYPFHDYGGYQDGVSYTGTTTFHFWGDYRFVNCNGAATGNGRTYLNGSTTAGTQTPAHFPNVVLHDELYGLTYHMVVHGDLTLMEKGNFHHWVSNPTQFKRIDILGDQPNSPYNGDMNLTAGKEYVFDSYYSHYYASTHVNYPLNSRINVVGTLNAIGTCKEPIAIRTYTGKPMSLSVGAANIQYAYIEGMDNTGNPAITALNSVDGGNNSNFNFTVGTAGTTLYWRALQSDATDFEGVWEDPGHWTTNPLSPVGDSACVPSTADTVVFDLMSFSGTSNGCTIDQLAFCKTIWIKADVNLTNSNLLNPTGNLFISESLLIDLPMTQYNYTGQISFVGDGGSVRTSGTTLINSFFSFKSEYGEWDLEDDFNLDNVHRTWHGILQLTAGVLNTNGHTLNLSNAFYSHGQNKRHLNLGNSTVNMLCEGRNADNSYTYPWYIPNGHRNVDVSGANSIINFYDNNITAYDLYFYMGYDSLTWRTVSNSASYDSNRIEYGEVNFMATNHNSRVTGYADYGYLDFDGTAYINGNNLMDSIKMEGGQFYYFHNNNRQHLKSPHGKIIANGSGSSFVNIESVSGTSYFHKEWGDYFCLDFVKVKDSEGTKGINPNTGVTDPDLFFYTGTNSDNINGSATGIWNFSLLFSTHTAQAPLISLCDGVDSVDITVSITGNDYYDIRYNWLDELGNMGADTVQVFDNDGDASTPYIYTVRKPVLASGFYAFDIATFRCDKRTAAAIDTAWVNLEKPNTLVTVDRDANCYLTNEGEWVDFYDDTDAKPILSILDSLNIADADSLKNTDVSVFFDATTQYHAGRPYLQRNWRITPNNNVGAKVRLFFTQEELDSLYMKTFHGTYGMPFDHSNAYVEVWKFDATPHPNSFIGSSAPTVVPHTVIPVSGPNAKALTSTTDILAVEFEVNSFSHFIIVPTEPVLLPIDLLRFEAKANKEKQVELDWKIAKNNHVDYFEILRSADGLHFETLAEVNKQEISTNYHALDQNPFEEYNYYQLRIIDRDGKTHLSPVKVVYLPSNRILEVFPNPIQEGDLNVRLSLESDEPLVIELINPLGQTIQTKTQTVNTGQNLFSINNKSLSKGVYILRIIQEGAVIGQRKIWKLD